MADKGKVKGIDNGSGGIVTSKQGVDYSFTQPYHKELCLNVDDEVKFDLIVLKAGSPEVAMNVSRLTAGTVKMYDTATGFGELLENKSLKKIKFYQPYPTANGIKIDDDVRYDLINTATGELAVNLRGVGE